MTGVCQACGREWRVRSYRGSRLADHRCPDCGGELRGRTAGRKNELGPLVACVVCGRRRREKGHNLKRPEFSYMADLWRRGLVVTVDSDGNPTGERDHGPHPAGAPCCWYHQVEPAEQPADALRLEVS